ncbi:MAG TPA: CBS domain-containing protein [Gaiellaceae bacterium]
MAVVREAMVSDPPTLGVGDSAQEAGLALARPEVRAVFVCEEHRFVGVVTRKTLVREVVATGQDPKTTRLGDIAEEPHWTVDAETPVEEAFRFMEEKDIERVPVVEGDRLVGVLSRSALQRRLAEDDPPPYDPDLAP